MLAINKGVYGIIMILSDIVTHLKQQDGVKIQKTSAKQLFSEAKNYLDPVIVYLKNLQPEVKAELKSSYGSTGETKYWRTFQKAINDTHKSFNPEGMEDWFKREEKIFNERAFQVIRDIETYMKGDFRKRLEDFYGRKWFEKGVPPKIAEKAVADMLNKNREIEDEDKEVEHWDCLTIIAYREIALKNWQSIFDKEYTRPGEEKINGGKDEKTKWMMRLERIRNQNVHSSSVSEEELEFLESVNDWLIKKETRNTFQLEEK